MEKLNLIKDDINIVHRSLTLKDVLGRWPRAKVAHFHYSPNVEKILPRAKKKKKRHHLLYSLK